MKILGWSITKQAPVNYAMGASFLTGGSPQRQSLEQFLRAYGEDPWLHAAVSRIAQSVANAEWHLYKKKKDGTREEITGSHPLKDLLNKPNPQMTGNDLIELSEKFSLLTGKSYWYYEKKGTSELWEVPSPWMHVDADAAGNITGYTFKRESYIKHFEVEQIIPFVNIDPYNIFEGVGPAQSIGLELDMHSFARQTNRNYFYNGADPGVIVTLDDSPPQEEVDRLLERYAAKHRGYGRAHTMDLFTGGAKVVQGNRTPKDMDFGNLYETIRKTTLGAFGLPYTMLGGTDNVQRGNADTAKFIFADSVVKPRLQFKRRKLNEHLTPFYGNDIELDFDDPTPENREQKVVEATQGVKAGYMTINEARAIVGLESIEGGDVLAPQSNPFDGSGFTAGGKMWPGFKAAEVIDRKAEQWRAFVKSTEAYEKPVAVAVKSLWAAQEKEALRNLKNATNRDAKLVDSTQFQAAYRQLVAPHLQLALADAYKRGQALVPPTTPHTESFKAGPPVPDSALQWLLSRIGWAAEQIGNETAQQLAQALADGYDAGEGTDKIAARVQAVFSGFDDVRAQRIARTETLMAANHGAISGYKSMGVTKLEWYVADDERTCEDCQAGSEQFKSVPVDDAVGMLPLHPACRCTWLSAEEWSQ